MATFFLLVVGVAKFAWFACMHGNNQHSAESEFEFGKQQHLHVQVTTRDKPLGKIRQFELFLYHHLATIGIVVTY